MKSKAANQIHAILQSPRPHKNGLDREHKMTIFAKIIGTGGYLPPRSVSNDDLALELAQKGIETSDQWIVQRTGIHQRHLADFCVRTSHLPTQAARQALEDAHVSDQVPDLNDTTASTPDYVLPTS